MLDHLKCLNTISNIFQMKVDRLVDYLELWVDGFQIQVKKTCLKSVYLSGIIFLCECELQKVIFCENIALSNSSL